MMYHVSDPAWQEKMAGIEERIIAEDGLDLLRDEELISRLENYRGDKYVERVSQIAQAQAEGQKPAPEKQTEAEKTNDAAKDSGLEA